MLALVPTHIYVNFFIRTKRFWNTLPLEYRQLEKKTLKKQLHREIEFKNINVVNPKGHNIHMCIYEYICLYFIYLFTVS